MKCAEVREMLPGHVRDGETTLAFRRHLSRCNGCQGELARYESLIGSLRDMQMVTAEPPPTLVPALIAIPSGASRLAVVRTHVTRNRRAYLGGAAVALAGAAAGVVAVRRRGRLAAA